MLPPKVLRSADGASVALKLGRYEVELRVGPIYELLCVAAGLQLCSSGRMWSAPRRLFALVSVLVGAFPTVGPLLVGAARSKLFSYDCTGVQYLIIYCSTPPCCIQTTVVIKFTQIVKEMKFAAF